MTNWTADNKQFSLLFDENPLADFVELPDDGRAQDELWFSNIFCGVLRGALEMVLGPLCTENPFADHHAIGANVYRGPFRQRRPPWKRRYRDAGYFDTLHRR